VAPLVFGHTLRINPLLVIFALLFGAHLNGIIGALVALPLAAMLRETIVYLREHLRLEPWPVATGGGLTGLLGGEPGSSCPACGERMPAGDRYCRNCSEPLEAIEPEAPEAPVPAPAAGALGEQHDQHDDGDDESGDGNHAGGHGSLRRAESERSHRLILPPHEPEPAAARAPREALPDQRPGRTIL
jgi:hypothetical protein